MRTLIALTLIVVTASLVQAEEFTFENDLVRFALGTDGLNKSLVEKSSGKNWMADTPSRFAWLKKADKTYSSTAIAPAGELLHIAFGDSGITADVKITAHARHFVVELVALSGEVDELCLAQLNTRITENYGGWINARYNDQFTVCLMGLNDRINTGGLRAIVTREFGIQGAKVALIAAPTADFLDIVQQVEKEHQLPSPQIGGYWTKRSPDVRRGYLFTDLTEANVDETIRHAQLGEFGYIMTYSGVWSTSLGSYPINLRNFPDGEASLKRTIDKCHAAGLKVGMHMLTSFVHKHDPLVRPKPDPRLLKDAESALAADIDATTKEIAAATPLDGFPGEAAYYGSAQQGFDVVIEDEIIHYGKIAPGAPSRLVNCTRGYAGTTATSHKAGAKIQHLAQRYGCYLVDLRTSLKDELADRIAGVINRCGFDMIYFDGGECNSANGPYWYWVSQQQMAVYERVQRELFVQGSGGTPWTWHIFARGCCDDFAAVAPKQYLDYHKIADSWQHYTKSFMPAELGWWGFLDDTPDHPATSPDEVELYAVRMMALDCPVSLETNLAKLKKNGRTDELLQLLGRYERLRLGERVPRDVREKLRQGEWHLTLVDDKPIFRPVRYDVYRQSLPGELAVTNAFAAQPLKFRLQAVPTLAAVGSAENVVLLRSPEGLELKHPEPKTPMPGALAGRVLFNRPEGEQASLLLVGPETQMARGKIDLVKHRALAVKLRVDGPAPAATAPCAVLNVQLESGGETYRDYYIDLDFTGEKTIVLPEPTSERTLPEFRPSPANYRFKMAGYHFNYGQIVGLNFRWMRLSGQEPVRCTVSLVETLAESETSIKNPEIAIEASRFPLPIELKTGDYAEYWGKGALRVFDRNGISLQTVDPTSEPPLLPTGDTHLRIDSATPGPVKLTLITLGAALPCP